MAIKHFQRNRLFAPLAVGALSLCAALALAQAPGGPGGGAGGGGRGGGQPSPEMQAKMTAWRTYRDAHKNASQVQSMIYQIGEMEKEDPKLALSKPQATKMLALLTKWSKKPSMSETQAADVSKQMGAILNQQQLLKMTTIQPRGGFGGGGRRGGGPGGGGPGGGGPRPGSASGGAPGGGGPRPAGAPGGGGPGGKNPGGAPGGPRPGGGGGGFKMPDPPKGDINPLNPDSLPGMMKDRAKKSLDEFTASLQKQAK